MASPAPSAPAATPGQGAPADASTAPVGSGSQGTPGDGTTAAGKGDGAFNWGLFPGIPVEQQELLEPHLRQIQGYTQKLEAGQVPYRGLMDAVAPDQVENLVGFLNQYNTDGPGTIMGMVQQAIEDKSLSPEHLTQLSQLIGTPAVPADATPPVPGQEQIPEWAQTLQQRLDAQEQQEQQRNQEQMSVQQEEQAAAVLEEASGRIRGTLTQGGITEEQVSQEMITAAIIANNGDELAAASMLGQMRQNFLAAFTNGKTGAGQQPAVNGTLPQPPKPSGRRDPDGFGQAKTQGKQFLEQQMAAQATGG